MGPDVPVKLSDEALILLIEELAAHQPRTFYQRARAQLIAEQARRVAAKHSRAMTLAWWTLIAAVASATLAFVALLRP